MRDNAGTSLYDVYLDGGASTKAAQLPFEQRFRRIWFQTPMGDGIIVTEPLGAQNRNAIAAEATLAVVAAAPSGTDLTAQALTLNENEDLPVRFYCFVWNGSDAGVSLVLENAMAVGGTTEYVVVDNSLVTVGAGAGLSFMVEGLGLGDAAPQVAATTTSAATTGGDVTVQVRYI